MGKMIDLQTLAGGALAEKVEIEMRKLAENVMDPNTKAEAVRKLTVTVTVKPDENRQVGKVDIDVRAALAPAKGIPAAFVFDYDADGSAVMKELVSNDRNQLRVDDSGSITDGAGDPPANVVNGNFRR